MTKTLIAFFSRADENYFGGAMRYDTIILAYPNYWGTMPMAVFTFLESFDFSGKTILPLCTNEGSGMGYSETSLKESCKGASVEAGLSVRGHLVQELEADIRAWAIANK